MERAKNMSEHLEIEFKTLINKQNFHRLITYFTITEEQFFTQKNYYYDSSDFALKEKHMGLRIRTFAETAELTLKIPANEGLLEINESLSLLEAEHFLSTYSFPKKGAVYERLCQLGVDPTQLQIFGSLITRRAEIRLPQGLLALDESWYNNHHDYELELEVSDAKFGRQAFDFLLHDLAIPLAPAPNKIQRLFQTLDATL
jgi:uncharacterized protein YjbK